MRHLFLLLLFLFSIHISGQSIQTKEHAEKVVLFGEKIEKTFVEGNSLAFLSFFNLNDFIKKVIIQPKKENYNLKIFNTKYTLGFADSFQLFHQNLSQRIHNGWYFNFINYYFDDTQQKYHLRFRFFSEEEGINYHDYELNYDNETFSIENIYIYTLGRDLSDIFKTLYYSTIPPGIMKRQDKDDLYNGTMLFNKAAELSSRGKHKEAYDILSGTKGNLRKSKVTYFARIAIAAKVSDVYYIEAVDEFIKKFPEDPSTYLASIDYFKMLKNYNATIEVLEKLQYITHDSFIQYLIGNTALEFENFQKAKIAYKNVLKDLPYQEDAMFALLYTYNYLKEYNNCIEQLNYIEASKLYLKSDLTEFLSNPQNGYENLIRSKAYKKWKRKK